MKKTFFLRLRQQAFILIICLFFMNINIQAQWEQLNTETSASLFDIFCLNDNEVIACGSNGVIVKTTDGGNTWEQKTTGTTTSLRTIKFANDSIAYMGGGDYYMDSYVDTMSSLIGMLFVNQGSVLLKSYDGGETWGKIELDSCINTICEIFVIDADTLYLMQYYSGKLLKSTDGGKTWVEKFSSATGYITTFYFIENIGYLGINDTIYRSNDYGNSWKEVSPIPLLSYIFWNVMDNTIILYSSDMFFRNKNEGEVFFLNRYVSSDGFKTYQSSELPFRFGYPEESHPSTEYSRVKYLGNGMACGIACYQFHSTSSKIFNEVIISENNGECWYSNTSGISSGDRWNYLFAVDGAGDSTFYIAASNGKIYKATGNYYNIINEFETNLFISVYPNPADDELTIDNGQIYMKELYVCDVVGKEVKHLKSSNTKITVSVGDLCPGVYMVKVLSEDGIAMKKFVKE